MKTIEEPLNEYETINEPDEGAIPDSDAESAAGGRKESILATIKVIWRCANPACKQFRRPRSFGISETIPCCDACRQQLYKY